MKKYTVKFAVRPYGALGVHTWQTFEIEADNALEARDKVRDTLRCETMGANVFCDGKNVNNEIVEIWKIQDSLK